MVKNQIITILAIIVVLKVAITPPPVVVIIMVLVQNEKVIIKSRFIKNQIIEVMVERKNTTVQIEKVNHVRRHRE